jgi:hypothetical protein
MKIFWSWQSDTPGKIGRHLIRDALKEAIDQLKLAPDIEEPTTKESREALHLDHDIQGVPGSPDLARTIFDKIVASGVVVADVTLIGSVPDTADADGKAVPGKKLINSNVAIELGYALHALTDRKVLIVFNEYYGSHEDLPFDLRHKGGSIVFDLQPDADTKRISLERKKLKDRFVGALKPYLQEAAALSLVHVETPSTFNKAAYFPEDEPLAESDEAIQDKESFSYVTKSLCYLRLIPSSRLASPLPRARLKDAAQSAPLLCRVYNGMTVHNEYGAIIFERQSGTTNIKASTQLFQNGEIWSIHASLIRSRLHEGAGPWSKLPYLPYKDFEASYCHALRSVIDFAVNDLGLHSPMSVELGLVGIKGLYLNVSQDGQWGPIRKREIVKRALLNDVKQPGLDSILLDFFSEVCDSSGNARPDRLEGFPPPS